jgi:hypothetical protein
MSYSATTCPPVSENTAACTPSSSEQTPVNIYFDYRPTKIIIVFLELGAQIKSLGVNFNSSKALLLIKRCFKRVFHD